jgi:hypothetical protein
MDIVLTQGTTFGRGDAASPEAFTTVPGAQSLGPIGQPRTLRNVTTLSDTVRQWKKAMKDGQEMTLRFLYDPHDATQALLKADCDGETAHNYRITLPDSPATTITFSAHCIDFSIQDMAVDADQMAVATFKPLGLLTFA